MSELITIIAASLAVISFLVYCVETYLAAKIEQSKAAAIKDWGGQAANRKSIGEDATNILNAIAKIMDEVVKAGPGTAALVASILFLLLATVNDSGFLRPNPAPGVTSKQEASQPANAGTPYDRQLPKRKRPNPQKSHRALGARCRAGHWRRYKPYASVGIFGEVHMVDKVIVSNQSALQKKYGAGGFDALNKALQALVKADAASRNLVTQVIWVDDAAQMKGFGGQPPLGPKDERGNKAAIDAIAKSLSPDYIVILDGPDVVPHIVLDSPLPNDGDFTVDSDLP